jgi:multidrug efflux system outer membrane protein
VRSLFLVFFLSACAVGPDYKPVELDLPAGVKQSSAVSQRKEAVSLHAHDSDQAHIALDWWKVFKDPMLETLIAHGLEYNQDLLKATYRIDEARAQLGYTQANQFPSIDGTAAFVRTSNSERKHSFTTPLPSIPYNDYSMSALLSYEIDLWGRLRRATEAARATLMAEEINRDLVRLVLIADIANGYFNLQALDQKIDFTQSVVKSYEESYRYEYEQARLGAIPLTDMYQMRAELESSRVALSVLMQSRQEQQTALAVLVGETPREIVEHSYKVKRKMQDYAALSPILPKMLPSDLLERRPDIQIAEQNLIAANAQIGFVKADYFPKISLSSLIGLDSTQSSTLLKRSARYWNAGGSATMPLLEFGRTSSQVREAEAVRDQAVVAYQQVVQGAFKEAIDALKAEEHAKMGSQNALASAKSYAETLRLIKLRYDAGLIRQLDYLIIQRGYDQSGIEAINAELTYLSSIVNLYKALGGGWSNANRHF